MSKVHGTGALDIYLGLLMDGTPWRVHYWMGDYFVVVKETEKVVFSTCDPRDIVLWLAKRETMTGEIEKLLAALFASRTR
jgi:hypothetical protein